MIGVAPPPPISITGRRGLWLASLIFGLAFLTPMLTGCTRSIFTGDQPLQITSRDHASQAVVTLDDPQIQAFYRYEDNNTVTVLLCEGPVESPRRVMSLRMFWKARAGATPIDRTATNALVRLLDFRDAEESGIARETPSSEVGNVGVYAGAGFMRLHDDPALGRVEGTLWDADLRLTDRSETYADQLGRAVVAGTFTAERNDAAVTTMLRRLNQRVQQGLGYPRLVKLDVGPSDF